MVIHKLEDSTIRTIGASQVITDPAAVVKELIDNAIDAHASVITVEVHNNTLDTIQVRDNGHGIAPEDRPLAARPNCTSKISSIDHLRSIGGTFLGFRGQALASIAELSGSITLSTRVEGEPVAAVLHIDERGEVVTETRASLPVGTLVKVTDLLKSNPVRRQLALKNREKCLKKIKHVLLSYAFARPTIRVSLKVLKAPKDKNNWMYAPKVNGTIKDVALKIVGSACVQQCITFDVEENGYAVRTLLPSRDAQVDKVSGIGAFVSIDGRPVSCARGTIKQAVKLFRDSLKSANPTFKGIKEPFLYLNITCPSAVYDANVEPAKDEVLFEDTDAVIAIIGKVFESVYSEKDTAALSGDEMLIDDKIDLPSKFRANMSECPEEELDITTNRLSSGSTATLTGATPPPSSDIQNVPILFSRPDQMPTPISSPPHQPTGDFHPSNYVPPIKLARDGRIIDYSASQSLMPPPPSPTRPSAIAAERTSPSHQQIQYGQEDNIPLHTMPDITQRPRNEREQRPSPVSRPRPSNLMLSDDQPRSKRPRRDLDKPRPLSPPRNNRTIRDFLAQREPSLPTTALPTTPTHIEDQTSDQPTVTVTPEILSGRGFIPASELPALEARMEHPTRNENPAVEEHIPNEQNLIGVQIGPPVRRKTRVRSALEGLGHREHDAPDNKVEILPLDDPSTLRQPSGGKLRTPEGGCSVGKRRVKSGNLPLERIPTGQGTVNLRLRIGVSLEEIGGLEEEEGEMRIVLTEREVESIVVRLRALLGDCVEAGRDVRAFVRDEVAERGLVVREEILDGG
ncbi:hypothetical protein K470DRAFT_259465 [Piedraia hortae CBS 480.64]|uniref:DNA mismatch repair protein S5 domain-containing protein n=1 Tax=Piedraia hortae CBS 480.64 TaxID=1314780 RepID=A0A6A7BW79_9PEZI|nr:hypothetical protein K470DRAFT_259465 [Piedraia hortae CBS 480.64]